MNLNVKCNDSECVAAPKIDHSDRLKQLIKELVITREIVCNTHCNIVGYQPETIKINGDVLCHFHAIECIEELTRDIQRITNDVYELLK